MSSSSHRFEPRSLEQARSRFSCLALCDLAINFLLCSGILAFACLLLHVILTRSGSPLLAQAWSLASRILG